MVQGPGVAAGALAAYRPGFRLAAELAAAGAGVSAVVEIAVGPHRVVSAGFLFVGLLVGFMVGRALARAVREWGEDAPVVSVAEARLVGLRASSYVEVVPAVVGLLAVLTSVLVAAFAHVPTPIPGGMAAIALQSWLQARAVDAVESRRRGRLLRPAARMSFDGEELRLLPDPSGET